MTHWKFVRPTIQSAPSSPERSLPCSGLNKTHHLLSQRHQATMSSPPPTKEIVAAEEKAANSTHAETTPPEWTACWDGASQAWYWWNPTTNQTTWDFTLDFGRGVTN